MKSQKAALPNRKDKLEEVLDYLEAAGCELLERAKKSNSRGQRAARAIEIAYMLNFSMGLTTADRYTCPASLHDERRTGRLLKMSGRQVKKHTDQQPLPESALLRLSARKAQKAIPTDTLFFACRVRHQSNATDSSDVAKVLQSAVAVAAPRSPDRPKIVGRTSAIQLPSNYTLSADELDAILSYASLNTHTNVEYPFVAAVDGRAGVVSRLDIRHILWLEEVLEMLEDPKAFSNIESIATRAYEAEGGHSLPDVIKFKNTEAMHKRTHTIPTLEEAESIAMRAFWEVFMRAGVRMNFRKRRALREMKPQPSN